MNVLILLEAAPLPRIAALDAQILPLCAAHDLDVRVLAPATRPALIAAIEAEAARLDALILTPDPGPVRGTPDRPAATPEPGLGAVLGDLECFSVEVQPENIARHGAPVAGADAELFGMGLAGYSAALDLLRLREVR